MSESVNTGQPGAGTTSPPGMPEVVDRATFQAELDRLRAREKAHTREGDAIAAARRRLPMVEVDASHPAVGPHGPVTLLDAFEGRRQLIAYYFMWHAGHPAAEQCEGCTFYTARSASCPTCTPATSPSRCSARARTTRASATATSWAGTCRGTRRRTPSDALLAGRQIGLFHLVCYLRDGDRVFETYWTTRRGVEAMDYSYALMDLTVYGRQESWEDSPPGWPQQCSNTRTDGGPPEWPPVSVWPGGRPIAQWPRLEAGRSDDLGASTP